MFEKIETGIAPVFVAGERRGQGRQAGVAGGDCRGPGQRRYRRGRYRGADAPDASTIWTSRSARRAVRWRDIVQVQVFLVDRADAAGMNAVYAQVFPAALPGACHGGGQGIAGRRAAGGNAGNGDGGLDAAEAGIAGRDQGGQGRCDLPALEPADGTGRRHAQDQGGAAFHQVDGRDGCGRCHRGGCQAGRLCAMSRTSANGSIR